jgi:nucleotide-binding universal stress UspA family protein
LIVLTLAEATSAHQVKGCVAGRTLQSAATGRAIPEPIMFAKILHANDGSEPAFHAFGVAVGIALQNGSELHMACVDEGPYLPDLVLEAEESIQLASQRFASVLDRARALAEAQQIVLHSHVLAGHPVPKILELADSLAPDLLVIGAKGHSALYERMVGSRADRLMQLAQCPVLVVK